MKVYIAFLVSLICCLSCNRGVQDQDDVLTHIDIRSLPERNLILENIDKCHFVKLETRDNCLIREIEKIDFDEDKIFIKDKNLNLFVFNNEGVFLNEIGSIGTGPEEQLGIDDFFLDKKKKQICLFDMVKTTLYFYTYTGVLIGSKKVDDKTFMEFSTISIADDSNLILTLDNSPASLFNFRIVNGTNYKKINDCIPYIVIGEVPVTFDISKTARSGENLYLSAFVSDTIYVYDKIQKKICPSMVFEGEYKPLKKDDIGDRTFELSMEVNTVAKSRKRSIGIRSLYATNRYLHFVFEMQGRIYRLFWNLDRKTGSYYNYVCESTITNFFSYLTGTTDDAFVCAIPANEAIEHNWDESRAAKLIVDSTSEDDNPIIAFYYFEY